MRVASVLPLGAVLLAVAPATTASARPCAGAGASPAAGHVARARAATLCLLNHRRADHGLRPLAANARLQRAATAFSRRMVRRRFFSHVGPDGSTLVARNASYLRGARTWRIGENIGYATGATASPRHLVTLWMHSPDHRENILTPGYRAIGIGIALGAPVGRHGATYTTDFGARG